MIQTQPTVALDAQAVQVVVTSVPALVLVLLDKWLRQRSVKDPTLVWLYLALLSWCASSLFVMLALPHLVDSPGKEHRERVAYYFSPVSSILFCVASFRFSRCRELFRSAVAKRTRNAIVAVVAGLSTLSVLFLVRGDDPTAKYVDIAHSMLAVTLLGCGLSYSFHRYRHPLLVGLTAISCLLLLYRQVANGVSSMPSTPFEVALAAGTNLSVGMLFVALAIAWGVSESSRLNMVGGSNSIDIIAMFIDVRGSTSWSSQQRNNEVAVFMNGLRDFVHTCLRAGDRRVDETDRPGAPPPRTTKFLGDGYMFVWEKHDGATLDYVCDAAVKMLDKYVDFSNGMGKELGTQSKLPRGIGIGIDHGYSLRLIHENGGYDYVGQAVNNASKCQGLARPDGGIVISQAAYEDLPASLRSKFPVEGTVQIAGDAPTKLRATPGVHLPNHSNEGAR